MGFAGAVVALFLGPIIDRRGAKSVMGLTILLTGIHAFTLAFTQEMWTNDTYVLVMISLWILLLPIIMVCVLALAMSICTSGESATQFAIYMSVCNMGATTGSLFYGAVSGMTNWSQNYAVMGLIVFLLLLAVLMYRTRGRPSREGAGNKERGYPAYARNPPRLRERHQRGAGMILRPMSNALEWALCWTQGLVLCPCRRSRPH
jgi:predicted MFS family arabinose efflux permease